MTESEYLMLSTYILQTIHETTTSKTFYRSSHEYEYCTGYCITFSHARFQVASFLSGVEGHTLKSVHENSGEPASFLFRQGCFSFRCGCGILEGPPSLNATLICLSHPFAKLPTISETLLDIMCIRNTVHVCKVMIVL